MASILGGINNAMNGASYRDNLDRQTAAEYGMSNGTGQQYSPYAGRPSIAFNPPAPAISREQLAQSMAARYQGASPANPQSSWSQGAAAPNVDVPVSPNLAVPTPTTRDTAESLPQGATDPAQFHTQMPAAAATASQLPDMPVSPDASIPQAGLGEGELGQVKEWQRQWQQNYQQYPEKAYADFRNMNPRMAPEDVLGVMQGGEISPALAMKIQQGGNPSVPAYSAGTRSSDYLDNNRLQATRAATGENSNEPLAFLSQEGSPQNLRNAVQYIGKEGIPAMAAWRGMPLIKRYEDQSQEALDREALGQVNSLGQQLVAPAELHQRQMAARLRRTYVNDQLHNTNYTQQMLHMDPLAAAIWKQRPDLAMPIMNPTMSGNGGGTFADQMAARNKFIGRDVPPAVANTPADDQAGGGEEQAPAPPTLPDGSQVTDEASAPPRFGQLGETPQAPAPTRKTGKTLANFVDRMALPQADKDHIKAALASGVPEAIVLSNPKVAAAAQQAGYKAKGTTKGTK